MAIRSTNSLTTLPYTMVPEVVLNFANETESEREMVSWSLDRKVFLPIVFGLIMFTAVTGNLLVCIAVFVDRKMRELVCNHFIVSLAVADLLYVALVMTFSAHRDINQRWSFGLPFCLVWQSFDVMFCTASILHLCLICVDRYKQISKPLLYRVWMTKAKALILIALVWLISAFVSFIPVLVMNLPQPGDRCILRMVFIYTIVSASISFYVPSMVILVMNYKLLQVAHRHVREIRLQSVMVYRNSSEETKTRRLKFSNIKAVHTIGIMVGTFLMCWLPFFVLYPISSYDPDLIPAVALETAAWLGYANSSCNPLIYSGFNAEFREAFKDILRGKPCGRKRKYCDTDSRTSNAPM